MYSIIVAYFALSLAITLKTFFDDRMSDTLSISSKLTIAIGFLIFLLISPFVVVAAILESAPYESFIIIALIGLIMYSIMH